MTRPLFLGQEPSTAPVVEDLFRAARHLTERDLTSGTVSARYGHRFVVNPAGVPLDMLGPKHFVEVVDYEPNQDHVLCLGEQAPARGAALHALAYRAKKEVGALVQVELPREHEALARLPRAEKGRTALEAAMALLKKLRDAPVVAVGERDVVAEGRDVRDALAKLDAALGAGEA